MRQLVIIAISVLLATETFAVEKWNLQRCIDYAVENNVSIKQCAIETQYQENLLGQAKNNRLPSLNANLGQDFGFGRSLTVNNTYDNVRSSNTDFSASSSVIIYQGMVLRNSIRKQEYELKSSLETLKQAKEDISLSVTSAYLDILFAKELVNVSEKQIARTEILLDRTKSMIAAGSQAEGEQLETEAQLSREKLELVNNQNSLQIALLNLAQLLEIEDYESFDIEMPELPELQAQISLISAANVYSKAVEERPEILSGLYKLKSYETELAICKGYLQPSLSASASFYDQYYSASSQSTNKAFSDQIADNHRESVGLNVSIPIFNKFQQRSNIANSKLQIENQKLQIEGTKKELRKTIDQAYVNAQAAFSKYNANKAAVISMRESFRYIDEKFNTGLANSTEYNEAKTNLSIAESDLVRAKYEFIFRTKILDFYNGDPISL